MIARGEVQGLERELEGLCGGICCRERGKPIFFELG
jgi:hypothetical protein